MARIRPFRALRPRADVAARLAAVPYDVVSVDEARALADGNPLSFLHVSRAEIDLPSGTNPYADAVYERAADSFARLRDVMLQDADPACYVYRLRMGGHTQVGLAACCSVDEYQRDVILKHEKTRPDKEDDRTRHIVRLRAQTGPVFLTYRASAAVDGIVAAVIARTPLYDFAADDGVEHAVWQAGPDETGRLVEAVGTIPRLYIADGHHRAASAARAHTHFAGGTAGDDAEHAWFLAVAFPDREANILAYNRVVRDLGGRSPGELVDAVRARLPLRDGSPAPARRGECCMYAGGAWYTLTLGPDGPAVNDPIGSLDVSRLQDEVIAPILGITDVRTDKRIDFVGGLRGTGALERLVDGGEAAVAFSMYPVTVAQLMAVADAGGIMPPKSTWFEPKLRDGLLSHLI